MYLICSNTDNLFSLLQMIHSESVHQRRQNLKEWIYQVSGLHVLPYTVQIFQISRIFKNFDFEKNQFCGLQA